MKSLAAVLIVLISTLVLGVGGALSATPSINQNISADQTLSGVYNWSATYYNSNGVSADPGRVEFYVDGVKKGQDKTRPFTYSLDTSSYSNGSYSFKVRAMHSSTQKAVNTVSANISNAPPPPAQCADGVDNDGDGLVDLVDPGCSSLTDDSEVDPISGEPTPIAGQGYHLAFGDEFNTLNRSVWDDHIWYDDPPKSSWTGFQEVDSSGILHLRTSRNYIWSGASSCSGDQPDTCNWPINTITTHSSGITFQYGYFEARMKWTAGPGAWPGFWLISQGWANTGSCSTPAGELDMFEGQGTEPMVYYGTVHQDASGSGCLSDRQNGNNYQEISTNLTTGFHDYGMLWEPGHVAWYLDGVKIMDSDSYYPSLDQPMHLLLQMWVGGWTSDPTSSTPSVLDTQVDWVHVWQK